MNDINNNTPRALSWDTEKAKHAAALAENSKRFRPLDEEDVNKFFRSLPLVNIDDLPPKALFITEQIAWGYDWSIAARGLTTSMPWVMDVYEDRKFRLLSEGPSSLTESNVLSTVQEVLLLKKSWKLNPEEIDASKVDTEGLILIKTDAVQWVLS